MIPGHTSAPSRSEIRAVPGPSREVCHASAWTDGGLPVGAGGAALGLGRSLPESGPGPAVCATGSAATGRWSEARTGVSLCTKGEATLLTVEMEQNDSPVSLGETHHALLQVVEMLRPCKLSICVFSQRKCCLSPTAVNIRTAEIYRASFPDRGPEEELRAARALTGGPVSLKSSLC